MRRQASIRIGEGDVPPRVRVLRPRQRPILHGGQSPMPLKVMGGRLELSADRIVCQLHDGTTKVVCTITRQLLRTLGDYYQLSGSEELLFSELLPEIEQLA